MNTGSYFRSINAGQDDNKDVENKVKRRYLVYHRVKELLTSKDPRVDLSMFSQKLPWYQSLQFKFALALAASMILIPSRKYLLIGLPLLIVPIQHRSIENWQYKSSVQAFLNNNYHLLGENYTKVIQDNDYRYAAEDIPQGKSLKELESEVDVRFRFD